MRCGRGAWRGRERGDRTCSSWITSPRQDQDSSPCGPFNACRAGGCSATGAGPEAGTRTCAACVQRGAEHCCQRAHEGHHMDAAQARVAARALRAWLQPARPAGAGPVAASQAARGSPSARKRPRPQSSSPERETRRARPEHEHARRQEEFPPPPASVSRGGAHSLSGSGMLNQQGELRRLFPLSPPLPAGATGHGGARGVQAPRAPAGRPGGHARVGGVQPRPHPPSLPSRGLADIFGDISRRLTAARAGSSAKGEGADPPPGGREPPPRGGAGSGGFGRTPP